MSVRLLLAAEGAAVACFGGAMALYPGGAQHAPGAIGHSFWLNYLCDLTDTHARNGALNDGATLARAGMAALIGALLVMFLAAPSAFREPKVALGVRVVGALCVIATAGVPLSAWLELQWLHDASVVIAGPLGLAACAGVVVGLRHARPAMIVGVIALAAALVALVVYVACLTTGTSTIVLPIAQRIAVLLVLVWMLAVAHALRTSARQSSGWLGR